MQSKPITLASILAVGLCGAAFAQDSGSPGGQPSNRSGQKGKSMNIKMVDAQGKSIGTAMMQPAANGVSFKLDLKHLPPGTHAIELHENGRCEGPDFRSAGNEVGAMAGGASGQGGAGGQQGGQGGQGGMTGQGGASPPSGGASDPSGAGGAGAGGAGAGGAGGASPSGANPMQLGDITADAKGNVKTTVMLQDPTAADMLMADNGTALIVHSGATPAPDGSGRIACGVIMGTTNGGGSRR